MNSYADGEILADEMGLTLHTLGLPIYIRSHEESYGVLSSCQLTKWVGPSSDHLLLPRHLMSASASSPITPQYLLQQTQAFLLTRVY